MFNDAQLPKTEAFEAMRQDLQTAKSRRNDLALENMKLKRDLEEANLRVEQWVDAIFHRVPADIHARWAKMLEEKGLV
jgi:hypothetical protein